LLRPECWTVHHLASGLRHFDLNIADMLFCACAALELFRDRLDPDRRAALVDCVVNRGLAAYLAGLEAREWWRHAEFNWGPVTHGNAGLAALAVAASHPELSRRCLAGAREGVQWSIRALPEDGWWTEGAMYHTTTLAHLSYFAIALERAGGNDLGLSTNPRFAEALESRRSCLSPDGGLFNFSNCPTATTEWFLPHVYWWAERLGRPAWTTFEDRWIKPWSDTHGLFYDIEAFFYRGAHPPMADPQPIEPLQHFRGLDWVTWRGPQSWLAFRSGFNGGNHNNFDLGHFIFGRGTTRYLVDPGYGATETIQHNAVTVRNRSQADGARATITALGELEGAGFHLACDLASCYPHLISRHMRHLLLLGDEHLFVIDEIATRGGFRATAKVHFQTTLPVRRCGEFFEIEGPDGVLRIEQVGPGLTDTTLAWEHREQSLTRMTFRCAADLPEAFLVVHLGFGEPPPVEQIVRGLEEMDLPVRRRFEECLRRENAAPGSRGGALPALSPTMKPIQGVS
jgi:hypothetical protein